MFKNNMNSTKLIIIENVIISYLNNAISNPIGETGYLPDIISNSVLQIKKLS